MNSKVYIVGAGPGDPELLTVKAQKLICKADLILYDRLMSQRILDLAQKDCELIYVGKKDKEHIVPQEEINKILVESSKKYHTVVRLKGGDPFIFGRGGEEELALKENNIPFESVPGISSSVAAPIYAGIPLTHRHLSRSFAVITGHLAKDEKQKLNWADFVKIDTLVILMGVGTRKKTAQCLIDAGRSSDEYVAFIEKGATPQQKVITCSLSDVAKGETEVRSPATMVIGQVVSLRDKLKWFSEANYSKSSAPEELNDDENLCLF